MLKRTLTGIFMTGMLFLVIWLTEFSHFVFDAFAFAVGAVATFEMFAALKKGGVAAPGESAAPTEPRRFDICVAPIALEFLALYPLCFFFGYGGMLFDFLVAFLAAFVIFVFNGNMTFEDFAVNVFALVYPALIMGVIFVLNRDFGMIPVLLSVAIGTISDAVAYYSGSFFGKKKIFPKISPKKTYAGCVGGLIGGGIGGLAVYLIFDLAKFPTFVKFAFSDILPGVWQTVLTYFALGVAIALFSELGDLAASRVKRQLGIKDYGKILGSHGGVVDRIDSILFCVILVGAVMSLIKEFAL